MRRPLGLAQRQPATGPTDMWRQQVLYDCCLALIVIGVMAVLIGLIQLSLALVIIGVLGIEGIAWEMTRRGPGRSSGS
jgi:hypothetical protein